MGQELDQTKKQLENSLDVIEKQWSMNENLKVALFQQKRQRDELLKM